MNVILVCIEQHRIHNHRWWGRGRHRRSGLGSMATPAGRRRCPGLGGIAGGAEARQVIGPAVGGIGAGSAEEPIR